MDQYTINSTIKRLINFLKDKDAGSLALPHQVEDADHTPVDKNYFDIWDNLCDELNIIKTADAVDNLHDKIITEDNFEQIRADADQALYLMKVSQIDYVSHQLYWGMDSALGDHNATPLSNNDLLCRLTGYLSEHTSQTTYE